MFVFGLNWRTVRLRTLSQAPAHAHVRATKEAKASGHLPTAARVPAAATFVVDVHGVVAAKVAPLAAARLLLVGLYDHLHRALLLPAHLFAVHGVLLDLLNLRLEVCKRRVAAL
jgi:hypothetical protein